MNKGRTVVLGFSAILLIALLAAVALAGRRDDSKYRVFCANGKVEVEQRTLEQEKNARGSNVGSVAATALSYNPPSSSAITLLE